MTDSRVASKSAARRWAEQREGCLPVNGPPQQKKEVPTLAAFRDRLLEQCRANREKPSSVQTRRHRAASVGSCRSPRVWRRRCDSHRHLRRPRVLSDASGAPWKWRMLFDAARRTSRRAGLNTRGLHMLRHTFGSHLAMRGARTRDSRPHGACRFRARSVTCT